MRYRSQGTVERLGEEQAVSAVWYIVVALGILAAIINFSIAVARRKHPMVMVVRAVAGLVSLGVAVGVVLGKAERIAHPYLEVQYVFIGLGIFVFAVLLLPSYVDRGNKEAPKVSMQERAARPANATVRLRDAGGDEWVN